MYMVMGSGMEVLRASFEQQIFEQLFISLAIKHFPLTADMGCCAINRERYKRNTSSRVAISGARRAPLLVT